MRIRGTGCEAAFLKWSWFHRGTSTGPRLRSMSAKVSTGSGQVAGSESLNLAPCLAGRPQRLGRTRISLSASIAAVAGRKEAQPYSESHRLSGRPFNDAQTDRSWAAPFSMGVSSEEMRSCNKGRARPPSSGAIQAIVL